MVSEGDIAPDFRLRSDAGEDVTLSSLRGRSVVLYFYPKDDTPGCTTEACEFRDTYDRYREQGIEVIGVSPDPVDSHRAFKAKHELPFPLLADTDHKLAEAYGVWSERSSGAMGINRSTFVIDADGRIAKAMVGIKPAGHAAQILEQLA
jgi:thioredoxin-dependent peroxiredoxin